MYKTFFYLLILFVLQKSTYAQDARGRLVCTTKEIKIALISKYQAIVPFSFKKQPGLFVKQPEILKKFQPQFITTALTERSFFSLQTTSLPPDYYNYNLGWACKQEWKLEKATKIPVRLRLGSKEQVDYLEGKQCHY